MVMTIGNNGVVCQRLSLWGGFREGSLLLWMLLLYFCFNWVNPSFFHLIALVHIMSLKSQIGFFLLRLLISFLLLVVIVERLLSFSAKNGEHLSGQKSLVVKRNKTSLKNHHKFA